MAERGADPKVPRWRRKRAARGRRVHHAAAARRLPRADQPAVVDARAARAGSSGSSARRADAVTVLIKPGLRVGGPPAGPVPAHRRRRRRRAPLARLLAHLRPGPRPTAASRSRRSSSRRARCRRTWCARRSPGTIVRLGGVEGDFVLPDPLPAQLLFISAGSGITPIMSMLRSLDRAGDAAATSSHIHSARTPDDVIFGARAARRSRAPRRLPAARAADRASTAASPRPTSTRCARTGASARRSSAARPSCSTRSTEHWDERAATRDRLHMERFQPIIGGGDGGDGRGRHDPLPQERRRGRVRRRQPILVAGEEAGATLPFGCRMGICHTCVGRLLLRPGARPAHRRGARQRRARWSARASTRPRARSKSSSGDHNQARATAMTTTAPRSRSPLRAPHARADRGDRPRVRRDPREVFADLGERDAATSQHDRDAPPARRARPGAAARLALKPAWLAGTATLVAGQDPREHGDRPQRHARPVGLDERPDINSSTWDWDTASTARGLEALPQLRAPHLHEHPRQGQGPRLRDHADRPAPEVAPGLPAAAALQPACWRRFFEWGVAFHDLDFDAIRTRREVQGARSQRELKGIGRKARSQIVKDYIAFPLMSGLPMAAVDAALGARAPGRRRAGAASAARSRAGRRRACRRDVPVDADGRLHRQHHPQRVGLRDHLLRPLPRPDLHVQPGGGRRTRPAAAATCASCSAPPTSRAARSSTSSAATSATRSSTTSTPTCRARATPRSRRGCKDDLRALRLPYNTGPFLKQLGTVQRTILRLAFPGGKPRPKPGPYRGEPTVDAASHPHQTAAATQV